MNIFTDCKGLFSAILSCFLLLPGTVKSQDFYLAPWKNIEGFSSFVAEANFSQKGGWLAIGSGDNQFELYDTGLNKVWGVKGSSGNLWGKSTFTPDGKKLFISRYPDGNQISVLSTEQLGIDYAWEPHKLNITSMAMSPKGDFLATGSEDRSIKIWKLTNGSAPVMIQKITGMDYSPLCLAFSPDGNYLISGSAEKVVRVFKYNGKEYLSNRVLKAHFGRINSIAFNKSGTAFVTASEDRTLRVWTLNESEWSTKEPLVVHKDIVHNAVFSPDGNYIISAGADRKIIQWHQVKGKWEFEREFSNHGSFVYALAFSPDMKYFVSGGADKKAIVWKSKLTDYVKTKVEERIKEWQKRGPFEKSSEYQTRLSTLTSKLPDFINEAIQEVLPVDQTNLKLGEYNPDLEYFTINVPMLNTIYMNVPLAKAPAFKDKWNRMKLASPRYYYQNGYWGLGYLEAYDPLNPETERYVFDASKIEGFKGGVSLKFDFDVFESDGPRPQDITPSNFYDNYSIDENLPKTGMVNTDAIAVVIGNRDYRKTKTVEFAIHDAETVKKYLVEVMGFKEGDVFYLNNVTKGEFELYFGTKDSPEGKLFNAVKPFKSDVFVFYSGHGAPGLKDQKGYFVPIECDPLYVELQGYPIDVFYKNLAKLPAKSVSVAIDACFSGAEILDNISPIVIKVSDPVILIENGAILSSSASAQVSGWYREKQHGMFTYFFLKAIHNANADKNQDGALTYREIFDYVSDQTEGVPYYSRRILGVDQTPTLQGSNPDRVFIKY